MKHALHKEEQAPAGWPNRALPAVGSLHDPGILKLPFKRLLPFFSLWTMHVWIYWFNTAPMRSSSPRWLTIYGVMTLAMLAVAVAFTLRFRAGQSAGRPHLDPEGVSARVFAWDVPMTALMLATTASVALQSLLGFQSAVWNWANIISAGLCMGWGYLRWSVPYADLNVRDAAVCLFGSYIIGPVVKVVLDTAPAPVDAVCALALPVVSLLSLRSMAKTNWVAPYERRGEILYRRDTYTSLAPVAVCVFVFCTVRRLQTFVAGGGSGDPWMLLLGHIIELVFSVAVLLWIFKLNRVVDFVQLWRFVFLFLATAIVCSGLGSLEGLRSICNSVTTSLIVILLWLLLSDVAHHSRLHPFAIFGFGWSLYVGGSYLGGLFGHFVLAHSATSWAIPVCLGSLWALGVAMVFCLGSTNPDIRRIFDDMNEKVPVQEHATIDVRCDIIGRERGLTDREVEVLKLLAKGRSQAFIAEELYISENTVRAHARRLYAKLEVHTRDELQDLIGL